MSILDRKWLRPKCFWFWPLIERESNNNNFVIVDKWAFINKGLPLDNRQGGEKWVDFEEDSSYFGGEHFEYFWQYSFSDKVDR